MTVSELVQLLLSGGARGGSPLAALTSIERAISEGVRATRVADAFLAGYQAALQALVPELPAGRKVCLCATEEGGAHPRAIATTLSPDGDGFRLSGRKKWITGGPLADLLLVVASVGLDTDGRNRLRVVQVDAHAPGVTVHPMPDTPFTPEIPHAQVSFEGVAVAASALLPGDGYDRYLKPFRTVEDVHVNAAVLAYVLSVARRFGWPREASERLLAILLAARAVGVAEPGARETHLALAGVLALGRRFLDETREHWALVESDERARWLRDVGLLSVAERARSARTETAWKDRF
jgi:acyl-CoA dehydrogenase